MPSKIRRGWNWCCRFRHRKGYGVHSPSDFHLITFVIYEQCPYYAYSSLHELRKHTDTNKLHYREKTDKLLLRLANHLHPESILEIGTGSGIDTCYLEAGRQCPILTIAETNQTADATTSPLSSHELITQKTGNPLQILKEILSKGLLPSLIHLAHTTQYEACLEAILPHVTPETCVIVGKPYATSAKRKWWKSVIKDPRTRVTFDLYDIGIIFFDHKRIKEHRIVNFL